MAMLKQELHNIGRSLTTAADSGDFAAVAKWAKKALALVGGVRVKPVVATTPDLTPLTLEQATALIAKGRSSDIDEYTQQLFALEAYPELAVPLVGVWPSEAVTSEGRRQTLIQFVASEVGSGPYYGPTALTNGQILAAYEWNEIAGEMLALNPVYAVALARAQAVAVSGPADGPIPWGPEDVPVMVIPTGTYGMTPVSGYYGTGEGPIPG